MTMFKKLKDGFSKYRSVKVHVVVAILQFFIALGLMLPMIILDDWEEAMDEDRYSGFYIEQVMYTLFETFRLWLVLDSVVQKNSLTIYITGILAVIISASSIITLLEDFDIIDVFGGETSTRFEIMQSIFTGSLILLTFPALWAAYKMSKDFGWGIYKKIGANFDVQKRYRIVQCFSLVLKLNVFFEFIFFLLLNYAVNYFDKDHTINTITSVIALVSTFVAREAIARESHILMILFLLMQIEFLAVVIYFMASDHGANAEWIFSAWYNFAICLIFSILCFLMSIVLGVWCLLNFNKGLKEHVQWSFFGLKKLSKSKMLEKRQGDSESLLSTKIDMPIDED